MPMLFTDASGSGNRIVFANDSFLALTGFDRAEVLGQNFESLIARGTHRRVLAQVEAVFAGTSEGRFANNFKGATETDPQIHYRRKDGTEFWAALYISAVKDEAGQIRQHFISLVDQTSRMREQEQRELLVGELNHRVNNTLSRVDSFAPRPSSEASNPQAQEGEVASSRTRSIALFGLAILLVIAVGILDYVTTAAVTLGILYLLAIALAAWKASRTAGLLVAVFALITWAMVEHLFGAPPPSPWIILWNVAARAVTFLLVALLVSALCEQKELQITINEKLRASIHAADRSASRLTQLQGELQLICSWTNRIQSDGRWMRFEEFMKQNFDMKFTHGISEEAAERVRKLL
jgi:PAS domain S-box-containing protein